MAATWNPHKRSTRRIPKIRRGYVYLANISRSSKESVVPVLVLQTDHLNKLGYPSAVVVPCEESIAPKGSSPDHLLRVRLPEEAIGDNKIYCCMIDCVQMLNTRRFRGHLGSVHEKTLAKITRNVRRLLGP